MKALKLVTAAALFTGLTALTFAGPGVEYWNRMRAVDQARPEAKAKVDATAKALPTAETAANCATCSCCAKKA